MVGYSSFVPSVISKEEWQGGYQICSSLIIQLYANVQIPLLYITITARDVAHYNEVATVPQHHSDKRRALLVENVVHHGNFSPNTSVKSSRCHGVWWQWLEANKKISTDNGTIGAIEGSLTIQQRCAILIKPCTLCWCRSDGSRLGCILQMISWHLYDQDQEGASYFWVRTSTRENFCLDMGAGKLRWWWCIAEETLRL